LVITQHLYDESPSNIKTPRLLPLQALAVSLAWTPCSVPEVSSSRRAHSIMPSQDSKSGEATGPRLTLLSLAPEIVENVVKHVGAKRDLRNTRLACRELNKHATKQLYKDVLVCPVGSDPDNWNSASRDGNARHIPLHATIHMSDVLDHALDKEVQEEEEAQNSNIFERTVDQPSDFPDLDSVEIGYPAEFALGFASGWLEDMLGEPSRREELMGMVF
jgi:hypothetical protein